MGPRASQDLRSPSPIMAPDLHVLILGLELQKLETFLSHLKFLHLLLAQLETPGQLQSLANW